MTERELELYEMVRGIVPFAYKEMHLMASDRKRYDAITEHLNTHCADLKAETQAREEAELTAKGWSKVDAGWWVKANAA